MITVTTVRVQRCVAQQSRAAFVSIVCPNDHASGAAVSARVGRVDPCSWVSCSGRGRFEFPARSSDFPWSPPLSAADAGVPTHAHTCVNTQSAMASYSMSGKLKRPIERIGARVPQLSSASGGIASCQPVRPRVSPHRLRRATRRFVRWVRVVPAPSISRAIARAGNSSR